MKLIKNKYDRAFFFDGKLKKAFVHPELGQLWVTDINKVEDKEVGNSELNSRVNRYGEKIYYDIFGSDAFFLKTPYGMAVSYRMEIDIVKNKEIGDFRYAILDAVWNDGEENLDEYEFTPSGCGVSSYVYNKTNKVNLEEDLVIIGKTRKGDNLYGYKNTEHPDFENLYEKIYWVPKEDAKKGRNEFLKIKPEVFWVDPIGRLISFYKAEIISPAECGKPVIYLYPEETSEINVQVNPIGGISISDPLYKDKIGWNVRAFSNGILEDLTDGKNYPYLFWEGTSSMHYRIPEKGFVVATKDLDNFLSDKLFKLGLIKNEIEDFKEFWVPRMKNSDKPYYFITFLSQSDIDKMAPLSVTPRPDTVIRVMMDYKELETYKDVDEFIIETPQRKGFTVVEWGGMLK